MRALAAELDGIAEWRLEQARRRLAHLRERRAELFAFLGAGEACGDLFASAMMKRLDGLEKDIAQADADVAAASEAMSAERAKLRRAEVHAELLSVEARKLEEKSGVLDAIEAFLRRGTQGPDKP
ncbi:hypothetical protein [Methylocella sp.]|uniref:hypothetical protein n=1 Tax=Methylocella sp. TaxID=1978226 RepID=UPI003784CF97